MNQVKGIVGMVITYPATERKLSELESQVTPARTTIEVDVPPEVNPEDVVRLFQPGRTVTVSIDSAR